MKQNPKTGQTGKRIVSGGTVVRHPKSKSPGGHNGARKMH